MANTTGRKFGGRKKGTPNKTTKLVKDAILEAFHKAGGSDYLHKVAQDDQKTFCTLLGRVLPAEIAGKIEADMNLIVQSGIESAPGDDADS